MHLEPEHILVIGMFASFIVLLFMRNWRSTLIAAIAIPNLLNAIHRGRQKRSMADMRTIATAIGSTVTAAPVCASNRRTPCE